MGPLVRAAVLTNYLEVAQRLGLNPQPLLRRFGLTRAMLTEPDRSVPAGAVVALLEESARASDCITFGLQMAESRQLADFGAVSLLLTHQQTLRDALQTTIRYRRLLNEALAIQLEELGDTVIMREEVVTDSPSPARQATDLALGVMFRMCAALFGAYWRPYSINFTCAAPASLQVHRRLFGAACKLEFNADFNGFVFSAADLDRRNPAANPALARYAEQFVQSLPGADERSLPRDVRKTVYLLMPSGRATVEQVAESLGLNVRSLQRRLEDAGVTFSDLANEVRRDLALRYLDNPELPLGRIAELLGYSMPSSFTRWFAAQFGTAPARWRASRSRRGAAQTG
jgi:AraC-like DNA-binding protein